MLPVRVAYHERLPYAILPYFRYVNWIDWETPNDTPRVINALLKTLQLPQPDGDPDPPGGAPGITVAAVDEPQAADHVPRDEWSTPMGALSIDSRLYVQRPSDSTALDLIGRKGGVTMTIRGPRQIGKTSLLARLADAATRKGKRVVWLDFQIFENSVLANARAFYQQLCSRISHSLGLEPRLEDYWHGENGDSHSCQNYMERYVLPQAGAPVVLAMDEVDRIFGAEFSGDFFGMLRSWHNYRALSQVMRGLDMVLVASTEPQLYIPDPLQSPFNVARDISLADFTAGDVQDLNARYALPFGAGHLQQLMALTGGHPFLTHYALYTVASGDISAECLFETAASSDGPFDDHLRHLLFRLHGVPELVDAMRQIIADETCPDKRLYYRLNGAGLVRQEGSRVLPRCRLYAEFFRDRL
jgi:hypothetical protein